MRVVLHQAVQHQLQSTPVEKWSNFAQRICRVIPELEGREMQLTRLIIDGFRRCDQTGTLAPTGHYLHGTELRVPDILVNSIMAVAQANRIEIEQSHVVSRLMDENIFDSLENGTPAIKRVAARPGQESDGRVASIMQHWEQAEFTRLGIARASSVSDLIDGVARQITGNHGRSVECVYFFRIDAGQVTSTRGKRYQRLVDVNTLFATNLRTIINSVLEGRCTVEVVNETLRWYRDYLTLLQRANGSEAKGEDYWQNFEEALCHLYTRLSMLREVANKGKTLTRGCIVFPRHYPSMDSSVRSIILNDVFSTNGLERNGRNQYIVLPDEVFIVDRSGFATNLSSGDTNRVGLINIRGFNYDVSALRNCLIIPFGDVARVYNLETGSRMAEFTCRKPGSLAPISPTRVTQNYTFTPLFRDIIGKKDVGIGNGRAVSFIKRKGAKGYTLPNTAAQIVLADGICSVYDKKGNFIGAFDTARDINSAGITNISDIISGTEWRRTNEKGQASLAAVYYRLVRDRDVNSRPEDAKKPVHKKRLVYAPDLAYQNHRVTTIYPWGVMLIYAQTAASKAPFAIGALALRDRPETAGANNVSFNTASTEAPLLRARTVRGGVQHRKGNVVRAFGDDLHLGQFPPADIAVIPHTDGSVEFRAGGEVLGVMSTAERISEQDLWFWQIVRQVPGIVDREVLLLPDRLKRVQVFGTTYGTGQTGLIKVNFHPGEGYLPFGMVGEHRFILEGDPFSPKSNRRYVWVGDLLRPFVPLRPRRKASSKLKDRGRQKDLRIPSDLFRQGWRMVKALKDHMFIIDKVSGEIVCASNFDTIFEHGLMEAVLSVDQLPGFPEAARLDEVNLVYKAMHSQGVLPGDTQRDRLLTLDRLTGALSFVRTYGIQEFKQQLAIRGRYLFDTLALA